MKGLLPLPPMVFEVPYSDPLERKSLSLSCPDEPRRRYASPQPSAGFWSALVGAEIKSTVTVRLVSSGELGDDARCGAMEPP